MPHKRLRFVAEKLKKIIKFQPVMAVQGARQTGKSFFLKEFVAKDLEKTAYITFDRKQDLDFATKSPETFLAQFSEYNTLIIDEAQKVPEIFDAIKYEVDKKRVPGKYILSGSTEFSKKMKIRESLTGRISYLRMFPFTAREANSLEPKTQLLTLKESPVLERNQFVRHLTQGGFPSLFHVRNQEEKTKMLQDWLELIVFRDLTSIPNIKLDPNLSLEILRLIAQLEEPNIGNIAKVLRRDPRKIRSHIEALTMLFVLSPLHPHQTSTGKTLYFLCDVGLAHFLEASFDRKLQTLLLQELKAQAEFLDLSFNTKFSFYRTTRGSFIHFLIEQKSESPVAIKVIGQEGFDKNDFKLLKSFGDKFSEQNPRLIAAGANRISIKEYDVEQYLWESFL